MDLRTTFNIEPSPQKITYNDKVMFIGSCFATAIGKEFETGHLPVMINPAGTVYNPVSVCNTISTITDSREYGPDDLHYYDGKWLSFNHYTDFSSPDQEEILQKIRKRTEEAGKFLAEAKFLFVTFGTARVYRWNRSGRIVSNCHKMPASEFTHELLSVKDIADLWNSQLDYLHNRFPELSVVFTISPVRHWKDGAHGNQISKSALFLSVEELQKHPSRPGYFPAYEILMDDLRDYRFYDDDMLHPSSKAVDYIWEAFCSCYLDIETTGLWHEAAKITRAFLHRLQSGSKSEITKFAGNMLTRIDSLTGRVPSLNFDKERDYFLNLLKV